MDRDDLLAELTAGCIATGFDLVQPFALNWYNDAVAAEHRLPDLGRPHGLGVLIGNTRALWAPFLATWRDDAALHSAADPIDRYTETHLDAVVAALPRRGELRFAHTPAPRRPAIQRLADLSGLAPLSLVGLNVHPVYGPWIGLRAAVVFDLGGPAGPPPSLANPCTNCARTCLPAFERARAAQGADADVSQTWRLWLAVRDACPVGRAHRYSEEQIVYHYTKDRTVLR
jgi:methylmalonic aciduria homocystinuria type C protein